MLMTILAVLIFCAGFATALAVSLHLGFLTIEMISSARVIGILVKTFVYYSIVAGALGFAILILLSLRDSPKPFITADFFQKLVASLLSAGFIGLVFLLLNKLRI